MLFDKRKKSIITLGIGQAPPAAKPPSSRPAETPKPRAVSTPAETAPPLPAPVPEPAELRPVPPPEPVAPGPAAPAEKSAAAPVAAPPVPAAPVEISVAAPVIAAPEPAAEATPAAADADLLGDLAPAPGPETVQCPFCLHTSRLDQGRCEACGSAFDGNGRGVGAPPAEPLPEPEAPPAVAGPLERPDGAETQKLAHPPVPQILKETTLFTPATLRLQPGHGQTDEKAYTLNIGESSIGRGIDNTLAFPDEEFISRRHCLIGYHKYQYVLKDLDSANGTYVNDVRVRETILRDGDCVQIGSMRFIFDDPMERMKKKKAAAGED